MTRLGEVNVVAEVSKPALSPLKREWSCSIPKKYHLLVGDTLVSITYQRRGLNTRGGIQLLSLPVRKWEHACTHARFALTRTLFAHTCARCQGFHVDLK